MAPIAEPSASSESVPGSSEAPLADPDQPPEPEKTQKQSKADCLGHQCICEVDVIWSIDRPCVIDLELVTTQLKQAATYLKTQDKNFAIAIIDDAAMCALHDQHCGDPTSTDVLTFDVDIESSKEVADIAICFDEAQRQATQRGHAVGSELLLYAIHGMLHCDGHDDTNAEAFTQMHNEEDRILTAIGIGPLFSGGPDS